MKIHFSRSMFKGIKNLLKHDGLGKQKGPKNHSNLNAGAHRKSIKKFMDLGVEIERNREKRIPNHRFLPLRFSIDFGRVWGGFWKGLGRGLEPSWRYLRHFSASFLDACIWNALWKGSWRLLGSIWPRF